MVEEGFRGTQLGSSRSLPRFASDNDFATSQSSIYAIDSQASVNTVSSPNTSYQIPDDEAPLTISRTHVENVLPVLVDDANNSDCASIVSGEQNTRERNKRSRRDSVRQDIISVNKNFSAAGDENEVVIVE